MKPIEHGTDRGYQAHRRRRQVPCIECVAGHAAYQQEVRARPKDAPVTPRELVPCGSPSAYRRHIRRGEDACAECRAAHVADVAQYKQPGRRAS